MGVAGEGEGDEEVQDSNLIKQRYYDELYKAYKGERSFNPKFENFNKLDSKGISDTEKDEYWQWNYCYVFKNPDAQKDEKFITIEKAK